jgi:hypothetical protein
MPTSKTRIEPRLSAYQLAEFIIASENRKIRILEEAKHPPEDGSPKIPQYLIATDGIADFLASPHRDSAILVTLRERLEQRRDDANLKSYTRDDARRSLSMLDVFERTQNELGLKRLAFDPPAGGVPPLLIHGVTVSVSPDLMVMGVRKKAECIGSCFIKLSQGTDGETAAEKRKEWYRLLAVLAHTFTHERLGHVGVAHPDLSMVIDVPRGECFHASGLIERGERIRNNCRFVKSMWRDI